MTPHPARSTHDLPMNPPERPHARAHVWRSLAFASVAVLAGCSYSEVGPGPATETAVASAPATGTVVVPAASAVAVAVAPPRARSCRSDSDCGANRSAGLCTPRPGTRELADAEDFLARAMSLHDLVTRLGDPSSSSPLATIQQRVREDLTKYGRIAQGQGPDGSDGQGARLTDEQMQDASWMQSGATQADVLIRQFAFALAKSPLTTDAQTLHADIAGDSAGLHLDKVASDLQAFLQDIEVVAAPVNDLITLRESDGGPLTPKSGAGALLVYLGPVMKELNDATDRARASLDPAASSQLEAELTLVSKGHDLVGREGIVGTCLGAR